MRTARKGAFALCAVALTIAVLMTFAVPSAAYANEGWMYDPDAQTLTSSSGVTLNNVTAAGSALTIGDNRNRDDLGPSLDLQGKIEDEYTITAIGSYAFSGCTSLESVKIPDGVTAIGDRAFYGCTSLTSVTIPASVETIEVYAFSDCSSLTSICVDDANTRYSSKEGVLFSDGGGTLVRFPGRRGGQYEIPNNVTAIGNHAFDGCSSLTSVTIPDGVKTIGDSAFAGCSSLTSMTIPSSVETIGDFAFSGCISLKSVTIPDSVTAIGGSAFYSCSSLTSVTIPNSVETIGSSTFAHCSSLASVTIPASVETIGVSAFNSCSSLASVEIPAGVKAIGESAFAHCASLESICVDEENESYSSNGGVLFSGDGEALTLVCFPGGRDGQYVIPSGVTTIRADAFSYCTLLTSVTIPASVGTIGDFAFSGCSSLESICVDRGNTSYSSNGGVLFSKDGEALTLACFPGGKGGQYTIPAGVTAIGDFAFSGCASLTSVEIPASVGTIGNNAFYGCSSLTSVEIPDGVTAIGGSAFNSCTSLERVTVLAENAPTLGDFAFSACDPNLTIVVPTGRLDEYKGENNWSAFDDKLTAGYSLTVKNESGELDSGLYAEGDEVQVSANATVGGGQHVKWVLRGDGDYLVTLYGKEATFAMPAQDVTATWALESHSFSGRYCVCGAENPNYVPPAPTYSSEVTVSDNGTASVSPARASAGQKVTVACSPSEGFEVRSVLVSGRDGEPVEATDNGDGTWTFVMPDEGAEVSVVFGCDGGALCPSAGYPDVDQSLWYHDAVDAVVSAGLMTGYADGSGLFGPDDAPTRAQAATVLFRALGTDAKVPACGMADVDPGAWYAGPVDWAVSSGIMMGYGDGSGRFGVDDVLTREQLATVLWRAAGSPDAGAYDDSAFSDGGDASEWAETALAWAVGAGVLRGSDDSSGGTELRPTAAITRDEMAAMLERWLLLG